MAAERNEMEYVHGYSEKQLKRLGDQAGALAGILHEGVRYPDNTSLLEIGCGTGSQSVILAANNPGVKITSVDISEVSLEVARKNAKKHKLDNITFLRADVYALPFDKESFDNVFVCFFLEHLKDPVKALGIIRGLLRPGGGVTVIEGDHGSWYAYPESPEARKAVQCLVDIQAALGGNGLIGRELFPLLKKAAFRDIKVSPKVVYVDSDKPELVEGFSKRTFIAMVEGVRKDAIGSGLIEKSAWDKGMKDMYRATEEDGVFNYTFFSGTAVK
ncbi:MAG: methyltransferase domain-containing protein [Candidatus Omnitrophica bacterium]|nr:methyltransferase domain-containing protein [Candidatus Omnitrophota bacterium]